MLRFWHAGWLGVAIVVCTLFPSRAQELAPFARLSHFVFQLEPNNPIRAASKALGFLKASDEPSSSALAFSECTAVLISPTYILTSKDCANLRYGRLHIGVDDWSLGTQTTVEKESPKNLFKVHTDAPVESVEPFAILKVDRSTRGCCSSI